MHHHVPSSRSTAHTLFASLCALLVVKGNEGSPENDTTLKDKNTSINYFRDSNEILVLDKKGFSLQRK